MPFVAGFFAGIVTCVFVFVVYCIIIEVDGEDE